MLNCWLKIVNFYHLYSVDISFGSPCLRFGDTQPIAQIKASKFGNYLLQTFDWNKATGLTIQPRRKKGSYKKHIANFLNIKISFIKDDHNNKLEV